MHLWLIFSTWCSEHLSDGLIPGDIVPSLTAGWRKRDRTSATRALLASQLIATAEPDGVRVVDYLQYNPSREWVVAERERWSRNKRNQRVTSNVSGESPVSLTQGPAGDARDPVPSRPIPVPSRPGLPTGVLFGPAKPEPAKRKRKLPDDFEPQAQHRSLATELGVDLETELPRFLDHHRGKGSLMLDWGAALRTWLRNARRWQPRPGNGHSKGLDMARVSEQVRALERREAEEELGKGAKR